ncbi:MAG: acetolactate decarboxylase [Cyclobacteriaceae bacterium]
MRKCLHLLAVSFLSCTYAQELPVVSSIGELRQIMHQGQFEARVKLDTLVKKGTYGVGALDSLSGELFVIDGEVFRSEVENNSVITRRDQSSKATLFVYSKVISWDTLEFSGISDLETALGKTGDLSTPFAFQLIGDAIVDYHVINFDPITTDLAQHKDGAYAGSFKSEPVTILGFYSKNAKGVYTHHDSNLHMHVINADKSIMGHVDDIDIKNGTFKLLTPGK